MCVLVVLLCSYVYAHCFCHIAVELLDTPTSACTYINETSRYYARNTSHKRGTMTEKQLSEERLRRLKLQVLNDHRDFLCRELGDPARYLPYLRSKRVLDDSSAERIKSKATPSEKVGELINTLIDSGDGHPLDVLIEGIKRQKVQLHISRVLLKAVNKLIKDQSPHCASKRH